MMHTSLNMIQKSHFDGNVQATWYKGEKKDHYTWHTDNGGNTMRPREHGVLYERKLSCLSRSKQIQMIMLEENYSRITDFSLKQ